MTLEHHCVFCNSKNVKELRYTNKINNGPDPVVLDNFKKSKCPDCLEEFYSLAQIDHNKHLVDSLNTYTTEPGESLMGIALRELKDQNRWREIRNLNLPKYGDMGPHEYYPPYSVIIMPLKD